MCIFGPGHLLTGLFFLEKLWKSILCYTFFMSTQFFLLRYFFLAIFSFMMFFMAIPTSHAACISDDFAGGTGTELDPWQIETPAQLANVGTCLGSTHADKYFILNNDINLDVAPYNTGTGWDPIGTGTATTTAFYGKFNGNYNTISNLFISRSGGSNYGLFGNTQTGSVIENLIIEDVSVTTTSLAVGSLVGTLRGTVRNAGLIGGTVSGTTRTGGLIGYSLGGVSERVFSREATVTQPVATVNGIPIGSNIGGLIGGNEGGATVTDSYARTNIIHTSGGSGQMGGGIGSTTGSGFIIRLYTTGRFTTLATPPANVGAVQGNASVLASNAYWDTEASIGFSTSPSGTGLTTTQMKDSSNYAGWDFDTVWAINSGINDGYPYLQWEENTLDNPIVTNLEPLDDAIDVLPTDNLVMTFSKASGADAGEIVIYNNDDTVFETIDVAGGQISGNGTTVLTIDPVNNFIEGNSYYVLIDPTAIRANDGNYFLGISNPETWNFTILDQTAPEVTALSPLDNATGVTLLPDLEITFNEPVVFASGTIDVYRASDDVLHVSIPVGGGNAELTHSVTFLDPLEPETEYYVLVSNDAFEDTSGNAFLGISDSTVWSFTTRSLSDPILSAPESSSRNSQIFVDFELSEAMLADTLQLVFTGDTTITLTLADVAPATPTQFFLDPTNLLAQLAVVAASQNTLPDGVYTVTLSHQNLEGLTLSTSALEVTLDTTEPTLETLDPITGATDVSLRPTLSLTFDEAVGWESQSVQIYRGDTDELVIDIPAGGGPGLSGSGTSTLRVALQEDLEPLTEYYVLIENEALRDLAGNSFSGITDPLLWRFTTGDRPAEPRRRSVSGGMASASMLAQLGIAPVISQHNTQTHIQALQKQLQELLTLVMQLQARPASASEIPETCTQTLVRQGMRGECVRFIQEYLNVNPQSGFFGPLTEQAVRNFQEQHNLLVDGIVGQDTWMKLLGR